MVRQSKRKREESPKTPDPDPRPNLQPFDRNKTHRLIEPGPVVLVTTAHEGTQNIMTMGFHMSVQHEDPPLLGAVIGPWDHSFEALKATGQCVLAVPGVDLAEKVVDIGNCSGDEVDKFDKFGFTALPSEKVDAPLLAECLANIECKVHDKAMVRKYNLWILEPVKVWVNPTRAEQRTMHHKGDGKFVIDGEGLDLQDRMTKWKYLQD